MAIVPGSRGLGCIRQSPDSRDIPLDLSSLPIQHAALPASVDFRHLMPDIWDQGQTNACTAYAACAAMVYQRRKQALVPDMPDASKVFNYWYSRKRNGNAGQDTGSSVRDAFKSLAYEGLVQEVNWPDGATQLEMDPGAWWRSVATSWTKPPYKLNGLYDIQSDPTRVGDHHRLATYRAVGTTLLDFMLSLANGFPVTMAMDVYDSFWGTGQDGAVPLPNQTTERLDGAHAVVACGYDNLGRVTIRNSWGTGFGMDGYGYLPAGFFDLGIVFDCWTAHAAAS
jgi:C1A family cysteine protease